MLETVNKDEIGKALGELCQFCQSHMKDMLALIVLIIRFNKMPCKTATELGYTLLQYSISGFRDASLHTLYNNA